VKPCHFDQIHLEIRLVCKPRVIQRGYQTCGCTVPLILIMPRRLSLSNLLTSENPFDCNDMTGTRPEKKTSVIARLMWSACTGILGPIGCVIVAERKGRTYVQQHPICCYVTTHGSSFPPHASSFFFPFRLFDYFFPGFFPFQAAVAIIVCIILAKQKTARAINS
jgi:hypothetical protein